MKNKIILYVREFPGREYYVYTANFRLYILAHKGLTREVDTVNFWPGRKNAVIFNAGSYIPIPVKILDYGANSVAVDSSVIVPRWNGQFDKTRIPADGREIAESAGRIIDVRTGKQVWRPREIGYVRFAIFAFVLFFAALINLNFDCINL